jgi:hypothetical protein
MSQALGQDVKSSAIQLGKALQDPIQGVSALQRVGVNFTDAQKEMIKQMVEAGKVEEAQKFILAELKTEFGGAAKAAGETFGGQLAILGNQFGNILEVVGGAFLPALKDLVKWINTNVLPALKKWADDNAPKIQAALNDLAGFIQKNVLPALAELAGWIKRELLPRFEDFRRWIASNMPTIRKFVEDAAKKIKTAFDDAKKAVEQFWREVEPLLQQFAEWLQTDGVSALNTFFQKMEELEPIQKEWQALLKELLDAAKSAFGGITDDAEIEFPKLSTIVSSTMDQIKTISQTKLDIVKNLWKMAQAAIQLDFKGFSNAMQGFNDAMMQNMLNVVGLKLSDVRNAFTNAFIAILNYLGGLIGPFATVGTNLMNALLNAISAVASGITNAITAPFTAAWNWISSQNWSGLGDQLIGSLKAGIFVAIGGLRDLLESPFRGFADWINGQGWYQLGINIFQGIMNGLQALAGQVAAALQGPLQALIDLINRILGTLGGGSSLAGLGALSGAAAPANPAAYAMSGAGRTVNNYYNLTIHSQARTENVAADFGMMRALAAA